MIRYIMKYIQNMNISQELGINLALFFIVYTRQKKKESEDKPHLISYCKQ